MNMKRWALAGLAAFAVLFVLDFIVHGNLLTGLYQQTSLIWRPQFEARKLMPLMTLGQLIFGMVFAWFYTLGYESKKRGAGQGLRFGFYVGLLLAAEKNFVWFVVLPIPFVLNFAWLASCFVNSLILGVVVGLIYKT